MEHKERVEAREDKIWTLIYWRNEENVEIKRDMKGLGSGSNLVSWTSPLTAEWQLTHKEESFGKAPMDAGRGPYILGLPNRHLQQGREIKGATL